MVKVISFNVRCCGEGVEAPSFRAPSLCECIIKRRPDSIGFQEATPEWMKLLKKYLGDEYGFVGVAREDGDDDGEYGPVFYRKDKFTLKDSGTIWLSDTPDKPSKFPTSCCTRICTWATLEHKETGKAFSHINTHLDHVSEEARLQQVDVLLGKIAELEKYGPVACTGDFNVNENAPVYAKMTQTMKDVKYTAPVTDKCGTYQGYDDTGIEDISPIDFVFIKNGFEPLVYNVIRDKAKDGTFLSDHFGLYTELGI
ncbi:MAG: endonuclease/exonuclease/phosphatase family protein [Clostridia bacterium]|nr:endonuclease/exonuclease/phosphatase family protein [Clostridia bacterium]